MTEEEKKAKERLNRLTESTNMRLDRVIGDLVKKIDSEKPTPDTVNHMTEILEQLQLIDIALRGSKYDEKSGIVYRLQKAEQLLLEFANKIKSPEVLKEYINKLIVETLKEEERKREEETKKRMNRFSWILGTIGAIFTVVNSVMAYTASFG